MRSRRLGSGKLSALITALNEARLLRVPHAEILHTETPALNHRCGREAVLAVRVRTYSAAEEQSTGCGSLLFAR
jgi:hypothetical protein